MTTAILDVSGDVAITVLGAVVVAGFTGWLTAVTTNRRLDTQLAHESERLSTQLAHDRIEADRAELRAAFDDAAAAAIQAFRRFGGSVEVVNPGNYNPEVARVFEDQRAHGRETVRAAMENAVGLTPHQARLQLRLGREHQTVALYSLLTDRANQVTALIPTDLPGTAQQAAAILDAVHGYTSAMEEFIESAYELVGTSAPALEAPNEDDR